MIKFKEGDGSKVSAVSVVVEVDFDFGYFIGQESNIIEFFYSVFSTNDHIFFIIIHNDEFSQYQLFGNLLGKWREFWIGF